MPICRYVVLEGGPKGNSIKSLNLGDIIYHKWSCEVDEKAVYCMHLHSCTADDGEGFIQAIVDADGQVL